MHRPSATKATESWNGTNWTATSDLNSTVKDGTGVGATNTAALSFGGPSTTVEKFGSGPIANTWQTSGALGTARYQLSSATNAPQNAALGFGGYTGTAYTGNTESYNGSTWTELNNLQVAKAFSGGAGIQTAALMFGGYASPGGVTNQTELWNGSNWTEVNNLNDARQQIAGCGTQTTALAFGGEPNPTKTEKFNGSSYQGVSKGLALYVLRYAQIP